MRACVRVKGFCRRFSNTPHLPLQTENASNYSPTLGCSVHCECSTDSLYNEPSFHGDCILNFTGGVPVAPGYGGGYPQQYYQGTGTHVCAQSKSF